MGAGLTAALPVAVAAVRRRRTRIYTSLIVALGLIVGLTTFLPDAGAGPEGPPKADTVVVIDPSSRLLLLGEIDQETAVTAFFFGDETDIQMMGDWDCDGVDTPGAYRPKTGEVFLRNQNSEGPAQLSFYYGNPGDIPLPGDFDGNGCDSVSVYRPLESRVYVNNRLVAVAADYSFFLGDLGDVPFVGDFDGDGTDTVAVHRPSQSRVFIGGSNTGDPDTGFSFGNRSDRVFAGDWNGDGVDTVAAYRDADGTIYFRYSNTAGTADETLYVGRGMIVVPASGIDPGTVGGGELPKRVPAPPAPKEPDAAPTPTTTTTTTVAPEEGDKAPAPTTTTTTKPPATTTTTTTVAPPPPPPGGDVDVEVYPGTSLQSVIQSNPAGTVFRINGTHTGQSVSPKDGQVFVGASGAKLDGNGAGDAFHGSAVNVRIAGLEITDYSPDSQHGAIHGTGAGWVVEDNVIHHNATVGVKLTGHNSVIRDNNIHHNGQLGISVAYADNVVVDGNEIAYNNWEVAYSWGWEAGGTKFWTTRNLVVRDNYSHHNHGPGLWSDHDNIDILYEGNRVEDNYAAGIFHEIGYDGVIRNNVIKRNGFGHAAWLWGAGIVVAASQNVAVYGNYIEGNYNGIGLVQQDRGSGAYGEYLVRNVSVHHNTIVNSGRTGAARDVSSQAIFSSNNTFDHNTYQGDVGWEWENKQIGWSTWLGYGHDSNGSMTS
jgi:parallel beta-helix repeat protein